MENVFFDYFQGIFTTSNSSHIEQIFQAIDTKVTVEMTQFLGKEVTSSKIKFALYQINLNKVHGPDRMTIFFYKKYWDIIR